MIKEEDVNNRYIKIIQGEDEIDCKSFFKVIHSGTIGLYEDFNKKKFILLMQMLHNNLKSFVIYTNFVFNPEKMYILQEIKRFD